MRASSRSSRAGKVAQSQGNPVMNKPQHPPSAQESDARVARFGLRIAAGLSEQAERQAGILAHGQKQWLEIGMLLMQEPRLLLVDEPVAGMTPAEMDRTAELLKSLAGSHSVVVVEHDMGFVRSIADQVTVLHQGRVLAEGRLDELQVDPTVIEVYLGANDAYH